MKLRIKMKQVDIRCEISGRGKWRGEREGRRERVRRGYLYS